MGNKPCSRCGSVVWFWKEEDYCNVCEGKSMEDLSQYAATTVGADTKFDAIVVNGEFHALPVQVLDHGYVQLIEAWGSDERIIEAARMSTGKGFQGWGPKDDGSAGDEKLLRYLWEHKHASPFEMAGMVIEVQAPIFIFREWHRHRTQSYNELSARYAPMPDVNYVPTVERLMMTSAKNKQAQGTGVVLTPLIAEIRRGNIVRAYRDAEEEYQRLLQSGIPKELARLVLPVGRYSRMRASANLRNWLAFMTLRTDPAAQWEIQQYAWHVAKLIEQLFPRTYALWAEK